MNTTSHFTWILAVIAVLSLDLFPFSTSAQQSKSKQVVRTYIITGRDSLGKATYREISPDSLPPTRDTPLDTVKVGQNWPKLKKGLSESDVKNLLGIPRRVEHDLRNATIYFWYGHRAVVFNSITYRVSYWDN